MKLIILWHILRNGVFDNFIIEEVEIENDLNETVHLGVKIRRRELLYVFDGAQIVPHQITIKK